jgi:hypothetical protein
MKMKRYISREEFEEIYPYLDSKIFQGSSLKINHEIRINFIVYNFLQAFAKTNFLFK